MSLEREPRRAVTKRASRYPDPDDLPCIELVELVTEYLDGALDEAERARLERHLDACDGCDTYVEQIRQTVQAVGHLPSDAVAPEIVARLVEVYRAFRAG